MGMIIGHYVKRELETIFVHRFSNDTMPIKNIFKNCTHYWILCGLCSYQLLNPNYTAPFYLSFNFSIGLVVAFCLFEGCNLMCHITLRNLRKPGTKERGIPKYWGFSYVSCANYYWEMMTWITFSIFSCVLFAWIFSIVSTL